MSSSESQPSASASARIPHLIAGLAATGFLAVAVTIVLLYGQAELHAKSAALSPPILEDRWDGRAAPLAVLRQDDLLLMYGSSELIVFAHNRATDFFASYPTGFAVIPIGARGFPMLSMAIALGSLGPAIHGRRIVISLSGTWLLGDQPQATAKSFRWHYSPLQTGDLIFRSGLPLELRRRFARRILSYMDPGDIDPLLAAALSCLAKPCAFERLLPALTPLWMLQSLPRRTRDYVHFANALRDAAPAARRARRPNWNVLETRADSIWRTESSSNAFGIQDLIWRHTRTAVLSSKNILNDSTFVRRVESTPAWKDLDLLLATMQATGARPLVLSTPLKGAYWNYKGVSASARERMYRRFDSAAATFGLPARSFSERDGDVNFLSEPRSHLSPKGWLVYDQAIDAFYHGESQ